MDSKVRDIPYGLLISYTFPGILLELEIMVAFSLFTPVNAFKRILAPDNLMNFTSYLIIGIICAVLLGFIVDGIHHFVFGRTENSYEFKITEVIASIDQMEIYKHFFENDFWYPYEAYANIGIAMFPGIILLPFWLHSLEVPLWFNAVLTIIYFTTVCIMIYEAYETLKWAKEVDKCLADNFTKGK